MQHPFVQGKQFVTDGLRLIAPSVFVPLIELAEPSRRSTVHRGDLSTRTLCPPATYTLDLRSKSCNRSIPSARSIGAMGPRLGGLAGCPCQAGVSLGAARLLGCGRTIGRAAVAGRGARMLRECLVRRSGMSLPLECVLRCPRAFGRRLSLGGLALSAAPSPFRAAACAFRRFAFGGRRQVNARASRLRKAYGNRLLRRAGAMFPFANMVDLLADKLAGLRRSRFALTFVASGPSNCVLVWHGA